MGLLEIVVLVGNKFSQAPTSLRRCPSVVRNYSPVIYGCDIQQH
jgi:hypothetical protein